MHGYVERLSNQSPAKTDPAPFEALIPASVADIWHVHERGFRMAIFNLGVLGGIVSCKRLLQYPFSGLTRAYRTLQGQ